VENQEREVQSPSRIRRPTSAESRGAHQLFGLLHTIAEGIGVHLWIPLPRCSVVAQASAKFQAMASAVVTGAATASLAVSSFPEFNGLAAAPAFRPSMPLSARPGEFRLSGEGVTVWCGLSVVQIW
jgi:hypothetical protein